MAKLSQFQENHGIINPYRVKKLIDRSITLLELDLKGMTVFTEAASNNFLVTPIIAARAKADKVYAVTTDSQYGKAIEIAEATYRFSEFCQVKNIVEVVYDKSEETIVQCDIVTNLGFVRPINRKLVEMMKNEAVIPLMCDSWELRKGDIDLDACGEKGIPVMATNEDHPELTVFDFCGHLCMKMLFAVEIEIYKSKIAVISNDKFGITIEKYLNSVGANTQRFINLKDKQCQEFLKGCDALIIADYTSPEMFIGSKGQISANRLRTLAPEVSVIQFCGRVEADELRRSGILCYPFNRGETKRMGMTLADLGPRPIIDLHAAGLKVGELMVRARNQRLNGGDAKTAGAMRERWDNLAIPIS